MTTPRSAHWMSLILALLLATPAVAQTPLDDPIPEPIEPGDLTVALEPVVSGMTAPNWATSVSGCAALTDRLVVTDQNGLLWAVDLATRSKRVLLDIRDSLVELGIGGPGSFDERGLLGVALHPDFADNGLLYLYTSEPVAGEADFSTLPAGVEADHQSVVREWRIPSPCEAAAVVDRGSGRELLRIDQPQFNHDGGTLTFGPDGLLYVSLGDGGRADDQGDGHAPDGNGQTPGNILGTILRIDPDGTGSANGSYGVPPDNPFVGADGVDEIWAWGLRNPFRISFDRVTGELYIADVGQNDIEEISLGEPGGNYGWRLKEGSFCFDANGDDDGFVYECEPGSLPPDLIDPIAEYDHDEGLAVVGGFVYRGSAIPELQGHYVFGDYQAPDRSTGRLFALDPAGEITELRIAGQDSVGMFVLGFGEDAAGELYVLANRDGVPFGDGGAVLRIAPVGPLQAAFSFDPLEPVVGQPVSFEDISGGMPTSWQWDFGNGETSTEEDPTVTFDADGDYLVSLTVSRGDASDTASQTVTVSDATAPPVASFELLPAEPEAGQVVRFTDTSTSHPTSWQWDFGNGVTSDLRDPETIFMAPGSYTVTLTVTNPLGSSSANQTVTVLDGPSPAGADVVIPAVARLNGVNAFFVSMVELLNDSSAGMALRVAYTPRSDIGGPTLHTTLSLPASALLSVEDPLGEWFGLSDGETGVGALSFHVLDGAPESFTAQSVVTARNSDASEYGQAFPAIERSQLVEAGEVVYLTTTGDAGRFRVNFGAMAVADEVLVSVRPEDPIGTALATAEERVLDAGGSVQINDVAETFGLGAVDGYLLRVEAVGGPAAVYASVLDGVGPGYEGTNDPTTILPLEGSDRVVLLAVGSVDGINEFAGSAILVNLSDFDAEVRADLFLRDDGATGVAATETVTVPAGGSLIFDETDVVEDLFGVTGIGTVMFTSLNDAVIGATAREYAIFRDGSGEVVGTAGQLMSGLTAGDLLMPGAEHFVLGVRETAASPEPVRSNLAAFNPGDEPVDMTVSAFTGDGDFLAVETFTVPPRELDFWTSVLDVLQGGLTADEPVFLIVSVDGELFVRVSRVNEHGDPVTLTPFSGLE
ncbi:MAG TPA: PQQ-dependent sugar dehydrogenase [Methylomirabilota bacterium]|nr:PQQ-dependent sugar dehydrogenase [Methylomirabilota bacterium]